MKKQTKNLNALILALLLPFMLPSNVFGEENKSINDISDEYLSKSSLEDLLEIEVVTASKKKENIKLAPASIYVVTENDIMSNGYKELKDVLQNVPGITAIDLGFFLFGGQRGFVGNFSQTLLLINGREMQNLIAAETFISHQFATHNIKRVEIIQGPASALYGANALVGVINIITKNDDKSYDKVEVSAEYGSNFQRALNLTFGKNFGDLRISGSSRLFASNGYDFSNFISNDKLFSDGTPSIAKSKLSNDNKYINASTAVPLSLRIDFKGLYAGTEFFNSRSGKGQENVSLDYDSQFDSRELSLIYAGYDYDINPEHHLNVEFQNYNERFWGRQSNFKQQIFDKMVVAGRDPNAPLTQDEIYKNLTEYYSQENSSGSKRQRVNFQYNGDFTSSGISVFDDMNLTAGYTFDRLDLLGQLLTSNDPYAYFNETLSSSSYSNPLRLPFYESTKNSGFLQLQKGLLEKKINLTLGGRLDYSSIYGAVPTFRGGVVLNPFEGNFIKLLFGQAFREPNIFELGALAYVAGEAPKVADLVPTTVNSYEVSISQQFLKNLYGNLSLYKNDATNFIVPKDTYNFKNSNEVRTTMGAEAQLYFKLADLKIKDLNFGSLNGDLSYAFTNPTWKDKLKSGKEFDALGIYHHRVIGGLSYDVLNNLRITARANFYDGIQAFHGNSSVDEVINLDPFTKIDLTVLIHDIEYFGTKMYLTAGITNLLDGTFYQPNVRRGGPKEFMLPGREFSTRLSFEF